jgi:hypothetical protein
VQGLSLGNIHGRTTCSDAAGQNLVTEAGFHCNSFTSFGAATRQHRLPPLGFHSRTKPVRLCTTATVRLKCALWHGLMALLLKNFFCTEQTESIKERRAFLPAASARYPEKGTAMYSVPALPRVTKAIAVNSLDRRKKFIVPKDGSYVFAQLTRHFHRKTFGKIRHRTKDILFPKKNLHRMFTQLSSC